MTVELLKWLHVLGAAVLFGTGAGIAFFMLRAHQTRDPHLIAHVAKSVVIADVVFTATAVVAQPVTGVLLAYAAGWRLTESWILASTALYFFTGLCWLPVVWIQAQMRAVAEDAAETRQHLPPRYFKLFRAWFVLGWPAFAAVVAIFWLMIAKPKLW